MIIVFVGELHCYFAYVIEIGKFYNYICIFQYHRCFWDEKQNLKLLVCCFEAELDMISKNCNKRKRISKVYHSFHF